MTETIENRIMDMLRLTIIGQRGYPVKKISFFTDWNGYDVYNFRLDVDKPVEIGLPWFYLVKGDEITVTNFDQALEIMAKYCDETEESNEDEEDREDDMGQESMPEPVPCMISCAEPRI